MHSLPLGMGNMTGEAMQGATKMDKANVKRYQAMLPETREMLRNFYRPFNQRLMALMDGDERWLWGY